MFSFFKHYRAPCKYYNSGGCRDGASCSYLHVCKYALKRNCRYGSKCKRNHSIDGTASSGANNIPVDQPEEETAGWMNLFSVHETSCTSVKSFHQRIIWFYFQAQSLLMADSTSGSYVMETAGWTWLMITLLRPSTRCLTSKA